VVVWHLRRSYGQVAGDLDSESVGVIECRPTARTVNETILVLPGGRRILRAGRGLRHDGPRREIQGTGEMRTRLFCMPDTAGGEGSLWTAKPHDVIHR